MRFLSPYATLILLFAAAVAILLAGGHFARHEEEVRIAGDRGPLNTVAVGMERELGRLERLYESHLRQIVQGTLQLAGDRQEIWQECDAIVGVSQWSLIHLDPKHPPDMHVVVDLNGAGRLPEPAFRIDREGLPRPQVLLASDELLRPGSETWGWIDEPGKPLLFWQRTQADTAVVLAIDPAPSRAALDSWFAQWAGNGFGPVRASGGAVALLGPEGNAIVSVGPKAERSPDFLLPICSRLGTWQFASWDRVEKRVRYDTQTQIVSGAIAGLVALIGIFGFVQQRRMLALAARRVSFVNRLSHELRTPLTNILLNLDLAAEALDEAAPEPLRRFALVREEAYRLGRLIENALTFSRKQRGRLTSETRACVPASVIETVIEQFEASFDRRGLAVRRTGNASVACLLDIDAFAQILSNLLSNVEKYVPGGAVEIGALVSDGVLTVTVTDQGPGIPHREAERIFQPFERLDSRINEGASGTGLGLAIARDLAVAAGGSLNLIPSGCGASFELRIPAPPAPGIGIISAA